MMANKARAVIYCRVSTSSDVQIESLEHQIKEARAAAKSLDYDLVEEYIDEGESGTTSKRAGYMRLLKDMHLDKFDIIITKSLDRLNRNTYEWYRFVDTMVQHGKKLYFYLDNSFYSPDEKLLLGIKAILADEYSRELSKKLVSAHQRRQREGHSVILTGNTFGYCRVADENGVFHIKVDPAEEAMILRIFELAALGYGSHSIANTLYNEGIRGRKNQRIGDTTIRRIIKNPLYYGTVVMHKRRFDFETKKMIDVPEEEWIYHKGLVPAIVTKELWNKANANLATRREKYAAASKLESSPELTLSGKIFCGECGMLYYVSTRSTKKGTVRQYYCKNYYSYGRKTPSLYKKNPRSKTIDTKAGCDNITVRETELISILKELEMQFFDFSDQKNNIINRVLQSIEKTLEAQSQPSEERLYQKQLSQVQTRIENLLLRFIDGNVSADNYRSLNQKLETEKDILEKKLQEVDQKKKQLADLEGRLSTIREKIETEFFQEAALNTFIECVDKIIINRTDVDVCLNMNALLELDEKHFPIEKKNFHFGLEERRFRGTEVEIKKSMHQIEELMISDPTVTRQDLAKMLHLSLKTVDSRLKRMKDEGIIQYRGTGRHGQWEVIKKVRSPKLP